MTQLSAAISLRDCKVEISTNGTTWTDISGAASSVEVGGGDRQTGEVYTFDGDTALITFGKREPLEITVKTVYTEGTSEAYETVRAAYEAGTSLYIRWSPRGGSAGNFQFATDAGVVTGAVYPVGEAGSGDPVVVGFTVKTPKVTKSVVA